ncbi:MAG: hypothetical protein R3C97_01490 [Geminicoccaceae bacterium]
MVDIDRLENVLLGRALKRESVTYGELLAYFERRVTRITVSALCKDIGQVCRRVEDNGGPDLACLVVRKSDGLPGEGYFQSLRDEGSYDGPSTGPQAEAEVRSRQEKAFDHAALLSRQLDRGPATRTG